MGRLIDADVVLGRLKSNIILGTTEQAFLRNYVNSCPTIDAVPVAHGKWMIRVEFNNGERVIATCSNCKETGEVRTDRNEWGIWHICSPYCPSCGAKMDGDGNDK